MNITPLPTIRLAIETACLGSHWSSSKSSLICLPRTPPLALISSAAAWASCLNWSPIVASWPVIGPATAKVISSAQAVCDDSSMPVSAALARYFRYFIFFIKWFPHVRTDRYGPLFTSMARFHRRPFLSWRIGAVPLGLRPIVASAVGEKTEAAPAQLRTRLAGMICPAPPAPDKYRFPVDGAVSIAAALVLGAARCHPWLRLGATSCKLPAFPSVNGHPFASFAQRPGNFHLR